LKFSAVLRIRHQPVEDLRVFEFAHRRSLGLSDRTADCLGSAKSVLVNSGGQAAAVADRIYKINHVARIVTAARNWRALSRARLGKVEPPPPSCCRRPISKRDAWRAYVKRGWEEGVKQAEDTFEAEFSTG